jgi:hypothetical protein
MKARTNKPVLFRFQNSLWIKVDNSANEVAEASCFTDAEELLLDALYVVDVQYPYHLKPSYEILETVLKIRKAPKASVAKDLLRTISDNRVVPVQP